MSLLQQLHFLGVYVSVKLCSSGLIMNIQKEREVMVRSCLSHEVCFMQNLQERQEKRVEIKQKESLFVARYFHTRLSALRDFTVSFVSSIHFALMTKDESDMQQNSKEFLD